MKCQKCTQPAVVHLTELLTEATFKKTVEVHLCYEHAIDAGLIAPGSPPAALGAALPVHASVKKKPKAHPAEENVEVGIPVNAPAAAAPQSPPGGLTVVRRDKDAPPETIACPLCGNTWAQFKQTGIMGCAFDYVHFETRILPLVKRAQEGGTQHAGKVPTNIRQSDANREVTHSRLRRELQKAVNAERYEEAARIRDQLKKLETT